MSSSNQEDVLEVTVMRKGPLLAPLSSLPMHVEAMRLMQASPQVPVM